MTASFQTLIASVSALVLAAASVILFFKARRAGRALESLRNSQSQAVKTEKDEQIVRNYQLIVDTIDQSNVMLWWAHVTRNGDNFDWNFRKPLQLNDNPIMRLASLADKGWMWGDDQAPDHREAEIRSRSAIVSGKPGYQQEFRIIGPDGVHWLSEEVFIRPDGEGQWNLAGVVTDVTRRHQAEEARMLTEVHLDQILKGADCILFQAVVTGDPDGEMHWSMFIPPSVLFRRIFGEDAAPGTTLWTREVVPDWDGVRSASRNAFRTGLTDYEQEYRVVSLGREFVLREHVKVSKAGPATWSMVGVIFDVTAARQAETELAAEKERLAVTLGSMTEGVITVGAQGRVLFMNKAAAELSQWDAAEAVGRPIDEMCILQDSVTERGVALELSSVIGQGVHRELPKNTQLKGRLGRPRLVEGRVISVSNSSSKRVGAVIVLRDVTERQRMEEQLHRAAKMESIGILAGGIAHDFNNILTAILSNLTLIELDMAGAPGTGPMLADAIHATKRAGELTQQLLTFSKGGDPVRAAVQLSEVVREAATFSNRGSSVRTEFEFPQDLWPADVDKAQIGQVVQNLVINAIQAMPLGGNVWIKASNRTIEPGSHSVLQGGDYVCISVADSGSGISPENIEKIFDPYFTTKLQGSGLGLATVFSIVRRHQGHIEVSSVLGKGSTFTFFLPAAKDATPKVSAHPFFEGASKRARVLFMDDEEPIIRVAEKLMQRMGLDFESAPDGRKAIEAYRAASEAGRPFDLVVMDLTIPGGMGGREAISELLRFDPSVRAIVSSGYSSDLAMSDFRKHGFLGMVAKPYDISELASIIRSVLSDGGAQN